MTNKVDNLKNRKDIIGDGAEETLGIATEGFSDPSGEYPRRDYFFATSINKAAKGEKVNSLTLGGGDHRVSLNLSDQKTIRVSLQSSSRNYFGARD